MNTEPFQDELSQMLSGVRVEFRVDPADPRWMDVQFRVPFVQGHETEHAPTYEGAEALVELLRFCQLVTAGAQEFTTRTQEDGAPC